MPSTETAIEWTETTWNPVHGCSKVSEGCANCYAARISQRYEHTENEWAAEHAEENVQLQRHHLDWPYGLDEPSRVFVNSMSDLFHEQVPFGYVAKIFSVIEQCPEHVFIALTKHGAETGRLQEWDQEVGHWPDNLWMGVSVENEARAYRMDELDATDAAVRWVSFEPLVGPVETYEPLQEMDWVVVGGESGPEDERREMHHAWARSIRRAARVADVPFYFKQSSGPKQGHDPELAEDGANPHEAEFLGAGTSVHRELPELPEALREARPDLAEREVVPA